MRPDIWTGRHSHAGIHRRMLSPLPPMSQWTDWRQGRRLHSLLLLPAFLPPSINQTSLTLHLHYDGCLSPTCLIISSSFTSPGCPLFLHSLPSLCSFSSRKFTWLAFCLHLYLYFIRGFHFGKRHPTGCLLEKKKSKGENTVLFLFFSQLSSLFIVYNSYLTRLLSLITLFFYFDVGAQMIWICWRYIFCQNLVKRKH